MEGCVSYTLASRQLVQRGKKCDAASLGKEDIRRRSLSAAEFFPVRLSEGQGVWPTSCLHPWLKNRIWQCVEAIHKDLLQWIVASPPGRMQECGWNKWSPAKCWWLQLILLNKKCVYVSVNKLFSFPLNPLMRWSVTVAFSIESWHDEL
jgi:hypothetical protein